MRNKTLNYSNFKNESPYCLNWSSVSSKFSWKVSSKDFHFIVEYMYLYEREPSKGGYCFIPHAPYGFFCPDRKFGGLDGDANQSLFL